MEVLRLNGKIYRVTNSAAVPIDFQYCLAIVCFSAGPQKIMPVYAMLLYIVKAATPSTVLQMTVIDWTVIDSSQTYDS